jgi:hypothetical protein
MSMQMTLAPSTQAASKHDTVSNNGHGIGVNSNLVGGSLTYAAHKTHDPPSGVVIIQGLHAVGRQGVGRPCAIPLFRCLLSSTVQIGLMERVGPWQN